MDASSSPQALIGPRFKRMANAIRALSVDAINKIQTGHPGLPLGAADMATVLFTQFLKFDPKNPDWADRDRFVLSAGHGSMLMYSLGYLNGYEAMTLDDIKTFRRLGSRAMGHPEVDLEIGVEATTGPLGQGVGMAVGMALAERMMRERYGSDLVDHYTYALVGDGCLMEGISYEATALAGHWGLDKLIVLFDDNGISIDGPTSLATSENQQARFEAAGWDWQAVDGHDPEAVAAAIAKAKTTSTPSIIACKTTIGLGMPVKEGTAAAHGQPPTDAEATAARASYEWDYAPFEVPEDILADWRAAGARGSVDQAAWKARLDAADASTRDEFLGAIAGELPAGWQDIIDAVKREFAEDPKDEPTRQSSQKVMSKLIPAIPTMIGGSADLTPSNLSRPDAVRAISRDNFAGRYIHFGIREHAMAAITNGIALHKGFLPFCATFMCFSDYCRPAIRLSALMKQKVLYIMTHDTITQGPDGPTHQPVEHFATFRATPNMLSLRPADAAEVAECWELALEAEDMPVAMILTREKVPAVRSGHSEENLCRRGAYVFAEASAKAEVTLLSTGSEVSVALGAKKLLEEKGVPTRVVSMPCLSLFDKQDADYRASILGTDTLRVSVEAATVYGWEKYVGPDGLIIGLDGFGAAGMPDELMEHFGITPKAVAAAVEARLAKTKA
ncbi:transketolase [Aliiruegeria lutimaris]|uniref:Transketolase n=1 Tax=Aliiruegeria lutimaris TaxID=571298 RepID=A0A1G8R3F5_9RHOB|nr:transketolase [Aliiruegeria lutimaris]SDJ11501.1 transketolase [Aliiruegeria lutimaris]